MRKNLKVIRSYLNQGNLIVFLFCLNICFLILGLISQTKEINIVAYNSIIYLVLSAICTTIAIAILLHNLKLVKKEENYIVDNSFIKNRHRLKILNKLLDNNLLEYHFQPIIDAKTGAIFGYEALMRGIAEYHMPPQEILDMAEFENRLYDIEKLTYQNIFRIVNKKYELIKDKKIFINSIPSHQLRDVDFKFIFNKYKNLLTNIVVEITERASIHDNTIITLQNRLDEIHCQIALDDFGAGYSNDATLLKTNPHYIKIDQALLRHIDYETKKQHLVSNIINYASTNNIKTIAEGIETYEELRTVIQLGINYIQGYYTAKPTRDFLLELPRIHIDTIAEINHHATACSAN